MKKNKKYLIYCLLLLLNTSFVSDITYGQQWGGDFSQQNSNEWIFNINAGFLSYFGDLSVYDTDITGKLENETGSAGGIMVTKRLAKPFGISVQLLTGNLKASKKNISFESTIFEYSLSAYIDLISLIQIEKLKKLEFQIYGGLGNMIFKSSKFEYNEGETIRTDHEARVPEFVYYFGGGLHYNISESFGVMSSLSLRRCENDKLDVYKKLPDFDYYTYLQFGISYYLKAASKSSVKNKARIAHNSNERLKALK